MSEYSMRAFVGFDEDVERLTRKDARFAELRRQNRDLWMRDAELRASPQDRASPERKRIEVERFDVLRELSFIMLLRGGG